jgi:hypothetical protein
VTVLDLQKRYRELGRLRAGEKGPKGEPRKRSTFRATTPSKELAERLSGEYGGKVKEWEDAPTQGTQWEVALESEEIDVLVPPQDLEGSQYYELWSGGGAQRRCDSRTELLSGRGCLCDPENRECKITTHLQVMLPQIPDVGVWRVTSHSFYAAQELPGTVELLNRVFLAGEVPIAKLGIETRTTKRKGKTYHFPVIVLRLPWAIADPSRPAQLLRPMDRPALPSERAELPGDPAFQHDQHPGWGERPSLPAGEGSGAGDGATPTSPTMTGASLTEDNTQGSVRPDPAPVAPEPITNRQKRALHAACKEADMDRDERLAWATEEISRPVGSFNDLTRTEAHDLLRAFDKADPDADEPPPPSEPPTPPPPAKVDRDVQLERAKERYGSVASLVRAARETFGDEIRSAADLDSDKLAQLISARML